MDFELIKGRRYNQVDLFSHLPPEIMVLSAFDPRAIEAMAAAIMRRDRIIARRMALTEEIADLCQGLKKQAEYDGRLQKFEDQALEFAKSELSKEIK